MFTVKKLEKRDNNYCTVNLVLKGSKDLAEQCSVKVAPKSAYIQVIAAEAADTTEASSTLFEIY